MKQTTLDQTPFRPRRRFKENYRKCSRKWCNKGVEVGSDLCLGHGIDHILNYHYGLDEYLIPQITGWTAVEYYKVLRKQAFEDFILKDKA